MNFLLTNKKATPSKIFAPTGNKPKSSPARVQIIPVDCTSSIKMPEVKESTSQPVAVNHSTVRFQIDEKIDSSAISNANYGEESLIQSQQNVHISTNLSSEGSQAKPKHPILAPGTKPKKQPSNAIQKAPAPEVERKTTTRQSPVSAAAHEQIKNTVASSELGKRKRKEHKQENLQDDNEEEYKYEDEGEEHLPPPPPPSNKRRRAIKKSRPSVQEDDNEEEEESLPPPKQKKQLTKTKKKSKSTSKDKSSRFSIFPTSYGSIYDFSKHSLYVKVVQTGSGIEGITLENIENRAVVSAVSEQYIGSSFVQINDVVYAVNHLDARYSTYDQIMKALTRATQTIEAYYDNMGYQRSALDIGSGGNRVALKHAVVDSIAMVVFARAITTIVEPFT